ncbi:hypothetical protein GCM10009000_004310 [Halobacterium noricense]
MTVDPSSPVPADRTHEDARERVSRRVRETVRTYSIRGYAGERPSGRPSNQLASDQPNVTTGRETIHSDTTVYATVTTSRGA